MQTNLRSRKGASVLCTAACLLFLGFASQVHGAGRTLFFISDGVNTKSNSIPVVVPAVTNTIEVKVVVVNRDDQTFTIEHQGRLHLFRVDAGIQIYNPKGKRTTLDWVTAGQTVSLKVIERQSGTLNLLTANVLPSRAHLQAAGAKSRKKKTEEVTPAPEPVVFPSEDARPQVFEETPVPTQAPVEPAPVDQPQPLPQENPNTPQPEPAPENPQPEQAPK